MNLFQIQKSSHELVSLLEETQGVVTTEVELLLQKIENQKGAAIAILCDSMDEIAARANARKEKAKLLNDLAKQDNRALETIKNNIMNIMKLTKQDKITVGALSVTLAKPRQSVEITNLDEIPVRYLTASVKMSAQDYINYMKETKKKALSVEYVPDKTLIKKDNDNGIEIKGARVVETPYLIIRG